MTAATPVPDLPPYVQEYAGPVTIHNPEAAGLVVVEEETTSDDCSFCATTTEPMVAWFGVREGVTVRSTGTALDKDPGRWPACAGCTPHVKRLDHNALAHRVARILATDPEQRAQVKSLLARQYAGVLVNLTGPHAL